MLAGLTADTLSVPVVSLDAAGASVKGLLQAVGAAFALGAPVLRAALSEGRFTRPFNLDWRPKFFINPCELAPVTDGAASRSALVPGRRTAGASNDPESAPTSSTSQPAAAGDGRAPAQSALEVVRELVAARAELPLSAVGDDSRLLGDLHLNSITVGQLIAEAAKRLNVPPLVGLTDFANATVGKAAAALEELSRNSASNVGALRQRIPGGVDSWVRPFAVNWVECPLPVRSAVAELSQIGRASCRERV